MADEFSAPPAPVPARPTERGLLANIFAIPPLIFRFQWNPVLLQERKRYKYEQSNSFGRWLFDQTAASSGFIGTVKGLWEDLKEVGPLLTATRPYHAIEGEPRQYQLEFFLSADERGPMDTDDHFGGNIAPDLAVLRSFTQPGWDDLDALAWIAKGIGGQGWEPPCWNTPPICTFVYGPLQFDCIVEDLDIKITDFNEDLSPKRAEVSVRLLEQTHSTTPITEFVTRNVDVVRALTRKGTDKDMLNAAPFKPLVELFM